MPPDAPISRDRDYSLIQARSDDLLLANANLAKPIPTELVYGHTVFDAAQTLGAMRSHPPVFSAVLQENWRDNQPRACCNAQHKYD
jgi:hypothetical protein